jgi:ATP-dependent RNA helicase RhlE
VIAEELKAMLDIEKFVGQKIPRQKLDGFKYFYTALFEDGKPYTKPVKGFRTSKGYSFGRYGR